MNAQTQHLTRQVRFPLKVKLMLAMTILVTISVSVLVLSSVHIFKEDKSAYIFDSVLTRTLSQSEIIKTQISSLINTPVEELIRDTSVSPLPPELRSQLNQTQFQIFKRDGKNILYFIFKNDNNLFIKDIGQLLSVSSDDIYQYSLYYVQGNVVYSIGKNIEIMSDSQRENIINQMRTSEGVKEVGNNLVGFSSPFHQFLVITTLDSKLAYEATEDLIYKSLAYGMFILGFAIIVGLLLARPLTKQLEKLFLMTQVVSNGNFNEEIQIKSHDEIGSLSDSFNIMIKKIRFYIEEMKEKARIESELKVAQLVQSSFFPNEEVNGKTFSISARYSPASECGGDWWGVLDFQDKTIVMIADATGHGVPAALITATINCCKSNLKSYLELAPEKATSSGFIMSFINQAICDAGKEIQMTAFIFVLDHSRQMMTFSNASHQPALLYRQEGEEVSKDNFQVLNDVNGPRLGQTPSQIYEEKTITLLSCDKIYLYTDGITECVNSQGAQFGERKFLKVILANVQNQAKITKEEVWNNVESFRGETPLKDDITFVAVDIL
jgi:sigma-B regulation protein RsbU (phosphoserine phosphatase)